MAKKNGNNTPKDEGAELLEEIKSSMKNTVDEEDAGEKPATINIADALSEIMQEANGAGISQEGDIGDTDVEIQVTENTVEQESVNEISKLTAEDIYEGPIVEEGDDQVGIGFGQQIQQTEDIVEKEEMSAQEIVTCDIQADVPKETVNEIAKTVEAAQANPEFNKYMIKPNNNKEEMNGMVPMKKVSIKGYIAMLDLVKMIIENNQSDNVVFESRPLSDLIRASAKGDNTMESYLYSHIYMSGADGKLIMPFALQLELNAAEYGMASQVSNGAIESVVLDTQLNEKLLNKRYGDYIMRDAANDIITLAEPKGDKVYVTLSFENVLNKIVLFNAEKEGLNVNNVRYVTNIQQNASNALASKIVFEIFEEEASSLFR